MRFQPAILILTLAVLTACAAPEPATAPPSPSPTDLPTITASPTVATATPTPTSPPTRTPTPSATLPPSPTRIYPTPALPALSGKDFYFGDFFFEDAFSPDCSLPSCWHGLQIGISSESDVREVFESNFGPTNFNAGGLGVFMNDASGEVPSHFDIGFQYWDENDLERNEGGIAPTGIFRGTASFSTETQSLQLLGFRWMTNDSFYFEVQLSPQIVIQQMGPPTYLFANLGPDLDQITFLILYEDGLAFEYMSQLVEIGENDYGFCFATIEHRTTNSSTFGALYILEPFDNGLDDLSPVQDATIGASIRWFNLKPFEMLFDISQDEVVERIMQEDNTCIDY